MQWKLIQTDFFVKLENEFGQYATGYSKESYGAAVDDAFARAAETKAPIYEVRPQPQPQLSISDLI